MKKVLPTRSIALPGSAMRLLQCALALLLFGDFCHLAWAQAGDGEALSVDADPVLKRALERPAGKFVCAGIGTVDLGAFLDGPLYYFDHRTRKVISVCGGACWRPRDPKQQAACKTLCPPPEWTQAGCDTQYQLFKRSLPAR